MLPFWLMPEGMILAIPTRAYLDNLPMTKPSQWFLTNNIQPKNFGYLVTTLILDQNPLSISGVLTPNKIIQEMEFFPHQGAIRAMGWVDKSTQFSKSAIRVS